MVLSWRGEPDETKPHCGRAETEGVTKEIAIKTINITSDDPGDWMELLFVGAGRLSGVGGAGQQPDDEGGGGGINEIEWKRSNQMNFLEKPQSHPLDSSSVCCTYYSLTHILKEKSPFPRNYLQSNQISPQRFLLASFSLGTQ